MEDLLQNTRWHILRELAEKPQSASELADATQLSLPNISQQVRLLEALGHIEKTKMRKNHVGKPKHLYQLRNQKAFIAVIQPGFVAKRAFGATPVQALLLQTFFLPPPDQPFIIKGIMCNEELLDKCSIYYLTHQDDLHLLLITDDVSYIRENYSRIDVSCSGKTRPLVSWTHSLEELKQGVKQNDTYFQNLIANAQPLYDPKQLLRKVEL